ncbi:hypothetical protein [Rhodohalobacter sp. 8-1]|uniref:hypothetical protein n=1 Tax=Rhodohalobacter sp. 8-1 TaxID=3131972 RepID=UPI0030EF4E65
MIFTTLLIIHITSGSLALLGALGVASTKIFDVRHKWHLNAGRLFFSGMTLVFVTTLPMTLIKPNLFLFLIGIFSFYLAWTGWRKALNRSGVPCNQDFAAAIIMGVTGLVMVGWGGWSTQSGDGNGITLMVFGASVAGSHFKNFASSEKGRLKGNPESGPISFPGWPPLLQPLLHFWL